MFWESLQSVQQFLSATEREMCIGKMEKMSSISSLMFWQLNSSLGSSECFIRRLAGEIVSAWPPLLVSSLSPSHADTQIQHRHLGSPHSAIYKLCIFDSRAE